MLKTPTEHSTHGFARRRRGYTSSVVPLRHIPLAITTDGVELHGEIHSLYPNDITVILTSPAGGLSCGAHVPYFAMGHGRLATSEGQHTGAITPYGQSTAERLLMEAYEYSRGKRSGWPVYLVSPAGWIRLPQE